jgi:hypothetical protein
MVDENPRFWQGSPHPFLNSLESQCRRDFDQRRFEVVVDRFPTRTGYSFPTHFCRLTESLSTIEHVAVIDGAFMGHRICSIFNIIPELVSF